MSAGAGNNLAKHDANSAYHRCEGETVRTVKRFSGVLLSIFTLAGCTTNPVAESYRDHWVGVDSAGAAARFVPYAGRTTLQASTDLEGDGENLTRDGYVLVGSSVYEGRETVTPAQIIAQGEKVRADLVLYQSGRGISRAAVAIADRAEPPLMPHPSGAPSAGTPGHGGATVTTTRQRDGVPNRPGTISTSMVPTDRLPVHSATFWRKRMTPSK